MTTSYTKNLNGKTTAEIATQLTSAIRTGRLSVGDKLPPIRQLATQLGVSPNTVANAYTQLGDAGLVISHGRGGTLVAEKPSTLDTGSVIPEGLFDLAHGNVDSYLLPKPSGNLSDIFSTEAGYDADSDVDELLKLAEKCLISKGKISTNLSVFSGALDAMERALRAHTIPGSRVWVEDPFWPPVLLLLKNLRLKPVPLLVDSDGCTLPGDDEQATAVILTPRAHNPTGITMSAERKQEWNKFLQNRSDCLLITDDYWGPLPNEESQYDGSLDGPILTSNLWLNIMSTSKFLGPDLRIAIASGNELLLNAMRHQQILGPRWVSHLLQKIAAKLWQESIDNGQLAEAANSYQLRRTHLCQMLSDKLGTEIETGEGLHLWLPVKSEIATVQNMAARGWAIQAGQPFRLTSQSAVRISLGNIRPDHYNKLVDDLAQSLLIAGRVIT